MLKNILLVGFGGGLGSIFRYLIGLLISYKHFPYATLTVNVVGSFFIGVAMAIISKQTQTVEHWHLILVTGFLGGFTTFSAFSWNSLQLIHQQQFIAAFIYVLSTFLLTFAAVFVGYLLFK